MGPGSERLEALIKNTEVAGEEFMNLLEDYEDEKISKRLSRKNLKKFSQKFPSTFPRQQLRKFHSIGKKIKDTIFYRQRKFFSEFLLSQCKTPYQKRPKN